MHEKGERRCKNVVAVVFTVDKDIYNSCLKASISIPGRWTHKGLEHEGASCSSAMDSDDESESCQVEAADISSHVTPDIPDLDSVIDLWQRCSILVGMHPDQVIRIRHSMCFVTIGIVQFLRARARRCAEKHSTGNFIFLWGPTARVIHACKCVALCRLRIQKTGLIMLLP